MRNLDFTSWQSVLMTLLGIALVTLIGVGIRLLVMVTIQQRRERMNRQINERLRVLIAAYKVLGGSFTGDLAVDPRHLRDLMAADPDADDAGSDRPRRIRDAVEAALSDVILLGTERHVRLAEAAARELVAGRTVHTAELVVALCDFVREALDLDPVPADLAIPRQGPARPASPGGRDKGGRGKDDAAGGRQGGGQGAGGGMAAGGMGLGIALGTSAQAEGPSEAPAEPPR